MEPGRFPIEFGNDLSLRGEEMIVYATTDSEEQAAAIAQRLINEGRDATTADVTPDMRSSFKYAVLAEPICDPDRPRIRRRTSWGEDYYTTS